MGVLKPELLVVVTLRNTIKEIKKHELTRVAKEEDRVLSMSMVSMLMQSLFSFLTEQTKRSMQLLLKEPQKILYLILLLMIKFAMNYG